MKYTVENGVHIVEVPADKVKILLVDKAKRTAAEKNYCNAGFFAVYHEEGQAFTLPVGHLVCDYSATNKWTEYYCKERGSFNGDKFTFDCGKWSYQNPLKGNAVSTLTIKDGVASIVDLVNAPACDYAVSGVPIMRGGKDVTFATYVKGQGWGGTSLYATYHMFVGIKAQESKTLYIMCFKTKRANMITSAEAYKIFKGLGFYDVIKLDGGGSTHLDVNGQKVSTTGNRRICSIITYDEPSEEEPIVANPRDKVVATAKQWYGKKESDGSHKEIIDVYNAHKPLARGYKVKYTDAWCATFVSAVGIKSGLSDIIPTECSCSKMIELHKKLGQWVEADNYVPKPGDLILYDWEDNGKGDNVGQPNHIGIVTEISGSTIMVIEGNIDNAVGYRKMTVNGKYIRGYCVPKYESKVTTAPKPTVDNSSAIIHTVRKGDTLWGISQRYLGSGARYKEIVKFNNLKSSVIHVGQAIKIPSK